MFLGAKEIRVDCYKSGGPGGQHKNKRATAVRVTHVRTGVVAIAEEERSQQANKARALARLAEKLRLRFKKKKPRIRTAKTRASRERVLSWKKQHGAKKHLRRERLCAEA
jgi:protein subunit release factor A